MAKTYLNKLSVNILLNFVAVMFSNMLLHVLVHVGGVITMLTLDGLNDTRGGHVTVVVGKVNEQTALVGVGLAAVVTAEVLLSEVNSVDVAFKIFW